MLPDQRRDKLDPGERFYLDWGHMKSFEPTKVYLAQWHILDEFPELRKDFDIRSLWPGLRWTWEFVFIGPADTVTGLHYDFPNNWFCQVRGTKEVILFPPDQAGHLCKSRKYDWGATLSDIDITRLDELPRERASLARAHGLYARVEAGDALVHPAADLARGGGVGAVDQPGGVRPDAVGDRRRRRPVGGAESAAQDAAVSVGQLHVSQDGGKGGVRVPNSCLSPEGAAENSQGRKPLVTNRAWIGAWGGVAAPRAGITSVICPRGSRPWLFTAAPPGLRRKTRTQTVAVDSASMRCNSSGSTGFTRWASNPASFDRWRSSSWPKPVSAMMRTPSWLGSARSRRATS